MKLQENIISIIQQYDLNEGLNDTLVPFIKIYKSSTSNQVLETVYEPSLFIILQGNKEVIVGENKFLYDKKSYFVSSIHLPVSGKIINANIDKPFISLQILFTTNDLLQAVEDYNIDLKKANPTLGACINELNETLLEPVKRMFSLKNNNEIIALSKLYLKEILYRVLVTNDNKELLQFAFIQSNSYKISKAILIINEKICENINVDIVAKEVNMSVSSFHKYFKVIANITPHQYIKKQKLQMAKKLLTLDDMDITGTAYTIGYNSLSQFSKDYYKYFNIHPSDEKKSKILI